MALKPNFLSIISSTSATILLLLEELIWIQVFPNITTAGSGVIQSLYVVPIVQDVKNVAGPISSNITEI